MTSTNEIKRSLTRFLNNNRSAEVPAWMGDLSGTVQADAERFNVYVVLMSGEVVTVRNNRVPNIARLPVIIGYDGTDTLQVLRSRDVYDKGTPYPELPSHADASHTWPGYDTAWIRAEQFMPGLAMPSSGFVIQFMGFAYYMAGWRLIENQEIDLSGEVAITGANFVLVEIDNSGVISFNAGATVASRELLEYSDIPSPSATKRPLFAVKMYIGQTDIVQTATQADIVDLRWSGFASGSSGALSVNWADVIGNTAGVLAITTPIYPHKWYWNAPPTVNDDAAVGYLKADIWIDQTGGDAYVCIDTTNGAAVWVKVASGSMGLTFQVEGRLAVIGSAAQPILFTRDTIISAVYVYCEGLGTAGSTIIDIFQNDPCLTSIFSNVCDNRPELFYNDANGWVKVIPTVTDFVEGDVLFLSIDQIAVGAQNMVVVLDAQSTGGGGASLTVTDGVTTVANVGQITVGKVINSGGGQITIIAAPDYILVREEQSANTHGGTFTSGAWRTRVINTEVSDAGGHCSIGSNQITLAAGTYECRISAPALAVESHKARLYNISDSADELIGQSQYTSSLTNAQNESVIVGRFTITASKIFEVQHRCQTTKATVGFGVAANLDSKIEIYTIAEFRKVA
jgi:hypothetical protein